MQMLLVYEAKVAVALFVFYLFYRFLLKKETFHRFNRVALIGFSVLSFLLPFCVITIHKSMDVSPVQMGKMVASAFSEPAEDASQPWWLIGLTGAYLAGVALVLLREVVSISSIGRIIRQGECVAEEDGCRIIVTARDIDPFSWMRYIVLSRADWASPHASILAHEKAHVHYRHSVDLLVVDFLSALQWFNPAMWLLRADLQELHEYEADDAVLRGGSSIRDYQYLLIRKAVSKSGYSVANSFNHSILKNRITMMSKSKSPHRRGLRVLYLLPLVCLGLGLQARTVYVSDKDTQNDGNPQVLFILRQPWGEEKEITRDVFDALDPDRIQSMEVLKDAAAKEKYGSKAENGVVIVHLKGAQELNGIVVVNDIGKSEEDVPFYLIEPETMPKFQGGDMNMFSRWLNSRITVPKDCKHSGTMKVGFEVDTDGSVKRVEIMKSVCSELDQMMLSLVASSPKWTPAMSNGKPVKQYITVPVDFVVR
jgi:TonB family protein